MAIPPMVPGKYPELEKWKKEIYACCRCGGCRDNVIDYKVLGEWPYFNPAWTPWLKPTELKGVCPVYIEKRWDHYTARGRLQMAKALLEGWIEITPGLVETMYADTTCDACRSVCKSSHVMFASGIDIPAIIQAFRAEIVKRGMEPEPIKRINASIEKYSNPRDAPREERMNWAKGIEVPKLEKGMGVAYFVGCTAAYDPQIQPVARAMVSVLNKAGVNYGVLGVEEPCCGSVSIRTGYRDLAAKQARDTANALKEFDVKKVVTTCAGCHRTFKVDFPELGVEVPFEVVGAPEFVLSLIEKKKIELPTEVELKATYHDPCHISRRLGIYDQPRDILKRIKGIELAEMYPTREWAHCCGGGGGLRMSDRALALAIGSKRLQEAQETGATALVTACPYCEVNLKDASAAIGPKLQIYDVVEIVEKAM